MTDDNDIIATRREKAGRWLEATGGVYPNGFRQGDFSLRIGSLTIVSQGDIVIIGRQVGMIFFGVQSAIPFQRFVAVKEGAI